MVHDRPVGSAKICFNRLISFMFSEFLFHCHNVESHRWDNDTGKAQAILFDIVL